MVERLEALVHSRNSVRASIPPLQIARDLSYRRFFLFGARIWSFRYSGPGYVASTRIASSGDTIETKVWLRNHDRPRRYTRVDVLPLSSPMTPDAREMLWLEARPRLSAGQWRSIKELAMRSRIFGRDMEAVLAGRPGLEFEVHPTYGRRVRMVPGR